MFTTTTTTVSNPFASGARPLCIKCGTPMMLARISPNAPGIDEVTYDCRGCDISETILTKR